MSNTNHTSRKNITNPLGKVPYFEYKIQWIFSNLLDSDDMLSFYQAKKILHSSSFVYENLTEFMSERKAIFMIWMTINMSVLIYQYAFASWFMYFITSKSGLKKIYKIIFGNPILGIFFYLSFYFKLIAGEDKEKFDKIADIFDLPKYEDLAQSKFLKEYIDGVSVTLIGEEIQGYKNLIKTVIKKVVSESIISSQIENIPNNIGKMVRYICKTEKKVMKEKIKKPAINIVWNLDLQSELDEWYDYLSKNKDRIIKSIRNETGKNKNERRNKISEMTEIKTDTGEVVCLNECKNRVKTNMGCYCDSECSPSILSRKPWCYVDPSTCKRGKYLPKFMGRSYDKCDSENTREVCYTGNKYKGCKKLN